MAIAPQYTSPRDGLRNETHRLQAHERETPEYRMERLRNPGDRIRNPVSRRYKLDYPF